MIDSARVNESRRRSADETSITREFAEEDGLHAVNAQYRSDENETFGHPIQQRRFLERDGHGNQNHEIESRDMPRMPFPGDPEKRDRQNVENRRI